jgi:hypothetical protein
MASDCSVQLSVLVTGLFCGQDKGAKIQTVFGISLV